jgi:hypothetical protein
MFFKRSVIETMKKRQSIRTYDNQNISEIHYNKINEYIISDNHLIGPFGRKGQIELLKVNDNTSEKGIKLGTYSFIKNPRAYLIGINENNKFSLVEFGYIFQKVVLYLTELGIGTCWMGGTFNRKSLNKEVTL